MGLSKTQYTTICPVPSTEEELLRSDVLYDGSTAHEVNPYTKLKLQSVIQPWIDHSISVTYNLPESTTEEEVSKLYLEAWKLGLKGLTVYRDGCRDGILTTKKSGLNLISMMHLKDLKILSVMYIISWLRVAHGKY